MRAGLALTLIIVPLIAIMVAVGSQPRTPAGRLDSAGRHDPLEAILVDLKTGRRLVLSTAGEHVSQPQFDAGSTRLVYSLTPAGGHPNRIMQVNLSRGVLEPQLVAEGFNPALSPRGDLAYEVEDASQHQLRIIRLGDGSQEPQTLACFPCRPTSWSPDGATLGFRQAPDSYSFWPDSRLSVGTYAEEDAVVGVLWLDPRRALVFSGQAYQTPSRLSHSVADLNLGRVSPFFENVDFVIADWSPVRREFLAASLKASDDHIFVLAEDGGPTLEGLAGESPRWSADGSYVLARTYTGACANGVMIYDADTAAPLRCFGSEESRGVAAVFGPDDGQVAYVRPRTEESEPTYDVVVFEIPSRKETVLLSGLHGVPGCLLWSPDSQWLVLARACWSGL